MGFFSSLLGSSAPTVNGPDMNAITAQGTAQQRLNNPNYILGSGESQTYDPLTNTIGVNLTPYDRAMMQQSQNIKSGIMGQLQNTPFQTNDEAIQNAYYNQAMGLLNPSLEKQKADLETSLSNKGIPIGSAAYNNATNLLTQQQGTQQNNLAMSALMQGQQSAMNQNQMLLGALNNINTSSNTPINFGSFANSNYNPVNNLGAYMQGIGIQNQTDLTNAQMKNQRQMALQNAVAGAGGTIGAAYFKGK